MAKNIKRTVTFSKGELAKFAATAVPPWQKEPDYLRLEEKYGKYIFVPFDIPPILPNDPGKFHGWFNERAIPTWKRKADIANPDQTEAYEVPSFMTVDSKGLDRFKSGVWDLNPISDMYDVFPEIQEQILTYLPFERLEDYQLWSSLYPVSPHRDATPLLDAPFAFRIKLYDENPTETLSLHKAIPDTPFDACEKRSLACPGLVNAFAWNNLRALHSSTKAPNLMKILMIVAATKHNTVIIPKFEELLDRSIAKFGDYVWKDDLGKTDYMNL